MEEDFNPEDHGIDSDEIAKIYAMQDMEEENRRWLREQANDFYNDFDDLDVDESIKEIKALVTADEISLESVILLLDNMISVFEEDEEYEKCHVCNQIKKGINA
jgi:hypothetical protein